MFANAIDARVGMDIAQARPALPPRLRAHPHKLACAQKLFRTSTSVADHHRASVRMAAVMGLRSARSVGGQDGPQDADSGAMVVEMSKRPTPDPAHVDHSVAMLGLSSGESDRVTLQVAQQQYVVDSPAARS